MRLYEGTVKQFRGDVIQNKIVEIISNNYLIHYGRAISPSEKNSWNNSLNFVKNALDFTGLSDNKIVIEYELPYSSRRIDVLLFGKNSAYEDNVVLIELKQWSNENVEDCETDGNIIVNYGRFKKEQAHPSLQVEGYHYDLKDFMTIFEDKPKTELNSCAYCHNYSKMDNSVLYLPKFSRLIQKYPLFSKEDINNLGEYLKERLNKGSGLEVFNKGLDLSVIRLTQVSGLEYNHTVIACYFKIFLFSSLITKPPPQAITTCSISITSCNTSFSYFLKTVSPSSLKISEMDLPAFSTIISSVSTKRYFNWSANILPMVVFPDAMKPINAILFFFFASVG